MPAQKVNSKKTCVLNLTSIKIEKIHEIYPFSVISHRLTKKNKI